MSRSTNTDQPEIISGSATLSITSLHSEQKLFACTWHNSDKSTIDAIGKSIQFSQDPYIMAEVDIGDNFVLQTKITRSEVDSQGNNVHKSTRAHRWESVGDDKVVVKRSADGFPEGLIFKEGASKFVEASDQPYPIDTAYTVFKSNEPLSDAILPEDKLIIREVKLYGTVQAGDA